MIIEFNVNRYVYVKLTDIGRDELRRQHEDLRKSFPSLKEYHAEEEDDKGFSKWQLHDLMSRLGHMCMIGFDLPFETNIKIDVE